MMPSIPYVFILIPAQFFPHTQNVHAGLSQWSLALRDIEAAAKIQPTASVTQELNEV